MMPAGFTFIFPDNDLWGALQLDRARAWREIAGRFVTVVARRRGTDVAPRRANRDGGHREPAGGRATSSTGTPALNWCRCARS